MPAMRCPVGRGSTLQASFGGYVLRCLRQFAPAQRRQQVSREDDTLPAVLGQGLCHIGRVVT